MRSTTTIIFIILMFYGELPPGFSLISIRRSIEFFGIPEETVFTDLMLELFVETYDYDGYDGSPTCSRIHDKTGIHNSGRRLISTFS